MTTNFSDINWLDELDLERAYRRLMNVDDPKPFILHGSSLLETVRQAIAAEATQEVQPLDKEFIIKVLKMNSGPIPGMDSARIYGTQTREVSENPAEAKIKKRGMSEEGNKSRTVSPNPSVSTKKPRAQSIVHTTFRANR